MTHAYVILDGKPERKRPLWRPVYRWEDNIKMYLNYIECEGVDSIELLSTKIKWLASVNTNESSGPIKGREFLDQITKYQVFNKDCDPCSWLVCWLVGWLVSWLPLLQGSEDRDICAHY
jgi:hypothetical protein